MQGLTHSLTPSPSRSVLWTALFLMAVTLALFWPATRFGFVNLDDYPYVVDNPMVANGLTWDGARQAFSTVREQWWLPLLWISYMADIEVFGAGPHGHHLVNVLLHAVNAGLLFWVLVRLTGSRWRSLFVAALFAWHPTRVEAVAWIAARKDVLSGLFFMLSLLAYTRYVRQPSRGRMALVAGLMLAGLMSKAILIVLPPVLLLLDAWPLRRISRPWGEGAWAEWKPLLAEKSPLIVLAGLFTGINLWTHTSGAGLEAPVSVLTRLGLMAPNVFAYLGKLAAPVRLNIIYPEHDLVSWPVTIAAAVAILGALIWAWRQWERRPWLLTGGLWFLVALLPILRGVRLGLARFADRWSYLPLIGLGIVLAWSGAELAGRGRFWRRAASVACGLILAACLFQTPRQLAWWRSSLVLFSRAVHLAPDAAVVQNSLGQSLVETGNIREGSQHFLKAAQLQPETAEYWSNRGVALMQLRDPVRALEAHERALGLEPDNAVFHNNRGNALAVLGKTEEAQAAFEEALRLRPGLMEAHVNLGGLLMGTGREQEALTHFEAAARLRPDVAMIWYQLGRAYEDTGRPEDALKCVERALQIDPGIRGGRKTLLRLRGRTGGQLDGALP